MALIAKLKLDFLDGPIPKLDEASNDFIKWSRCDNMVGWWLLNSMEEELAQNYVYAQFFIKLLREVNEQYGQVNGSLIFHIQDEILDLRQGNQSITTYYNNLKCYWDELQAMNLYIMCQCRLLDYCTCALKERLVDFESQIRSMQFFMGLLEVYDSMHNQILSIDPYQMRIGLFT